MFISKYIRQDRHRYKKVIVVCFPLIIGMSATTVMEFTDRIFLSNYSIEAISAATPAGISAYLFMAFLGGIGSYCGVFIAQYFGSGQPQKIGSILWQGIYLCLFSWFGLFIAAEYLSTPLFAFIGHDVAVQELEAIYFRILCHGAVFHIAAQVFFAFFSGRGLTRPIMFISIIGMLVNIPLDYALIFGVGPIPELGIAGAGIATVASTILTVVLAGFLVFRGRNIENFQLFSDVRFKPRLFLRLLKFGVPGAMQFSLDILAFTIFILLVGRIGTIELAATNIVLSINAFAFMPSMGCSQGISMLVGQELGRKNPKEAGKMAFSAIYLLMGYILLIDLVFIFIPEPLINLFIPADGAADYQQVIETSQILMKIVACYLFTDALYMAFTGVLKGAGDTRFIMYSVAVCSTFCFILPLLIGVEMMGMGIYYAWACVLFFIVSLFGVSAYRYRQGKWRSMLVI
ncbi:MAG: MATE family efflux transporter [Desulfobulbaceae bacterium]|nr:MAG: MATE family efflux transporter [Desulfobulbaceae bacterium]